MVDTPRESPAGAAIVVTLPREIDLVSAGRVGEDLEAAFSQGVGVVVAGMSGTRFCDTSGVHALVMAHKRAKASHAGFRVVLGPGEVRRVRPVSPAWHLRPGAGRSAYAARRRAPAPDDQTSQ